MEKDCQVPRQPEDSRQSRCWNGILKVNEKEEGPRGPGLIGCWKMPIKKESPKKRAEGTCNKQSGGEYLLRLFAPQGVTRIKPSHMGFLRVPS